jgi:hypothetical protein
MAKILVEVPNGMMVEYRENCSHYKNGLLQFLSDLVRDNPAPKVTRVPIRGRSKARELNRVSYKMSAWVCVLNDDTYTGLDGCWSE